MYMVIAKNCKQCNKAFIQIKPTQEYCSLLCRKKAENAAYYKKHKEKLSQRHKETAKEEDVKLDSVLTIYKEDALKANTDELKDENFEWLIFALPHRKEQIQELSKKAKEDKHDVKEFSYQLTVIKDEKTQKFIYRTMIRNVHTRTEALAYWKKMMDNKREKILKKMQEEARKKLNQT